MTRDAIRKIVLDRVKQQCHGTSVSQIGKRNDPRCQKWAAVGSCFCVVHGQGTVQRYIDAKDAQGMIDDLSNAMGVESREENEHIGTEEGDGGI